MLMNPNKMIDGGFVKNLTDRFKQVQPNAIDFTVDSIQLLMHMSSSDKVVIGEDTKVMRSQMPIYPNAEGYFELLPNRQYDISSNVYVEVPEGMAALLILRSTFVRNGLILASGLYDSGFKGNIGAVLHTNSTTALVQQGVRVGQIMFIESQSAGVYAGGYNTDDGQHWKDVVKGSGFPR